MILTMPIDPFESHPELEPFEKKLKDKLTLQQIRDTIVNAMTHIKVEPLPRRGYDKNYVMAVLAGLLIELEEKCQNN